LFPDLNGTFLARRVLPVRFLTQYSTTQVTSVFLCLGSRHGQARSETSTLAGQSLLGVTNPNL